MKGRGLRGGAGLGNGGRGLGGAGLGFREVGLGFGVVLAQPGEDRRELLWEFVAGDSKAIAEEGVHLFV